MTPLASEILDDLMGEFAEGATPFDLQDWLGESSAAIMAAIGELVVGNFAFWADGELRAGYGRFGPRPNPHAIKIHELLMAQVRQRDIARRLGVTRGVVAGVAARVREMQASAA